MNEGLDTGDILLEEKIKISNNDNLNSLSEKLSILSAKLFLNATSLIEENINKNTNPQLTKQNTLGREISYARMIEKSDFKVDWGNDANKISQKIKGNIDFINKLKSLSCDLFIVIAYGKILPKEILEIPKFGCWNAHASLPVSYTHLTLPTNTPV